MSLFFVTYSALYYLTYPHNHLLLGIITTITYVSAVAATARFGVVFLVTRFGPVRVRSRAPFTLPLLVKGYLLFLLVLCF